MIDNLILRLKYFQILTLFWLITLSSGCLQQIFWMVGHRVSLQHTNHVQVLGLESISKNINFSECATPSTIWRSLGRKRITAGAQTFIFTFIFLIFSFIHSLSLLLWIFTFTFTSFISGEKKDYSRCSDIHFSLSFLKFQSWERKVNRYKSFHFHRVWQILPIFCRKQN